MELFKQGKDGLYHLLLFRLFTPLLARNTYCPSLTRGHETPTTASSSFMCVKTSWWCGSHKFPSTPWSTSHTIILKTSSNPAPNCIVLPFLYRYSAAQIQIFVYTVSSHLIYVVKTEVLGLVNPNIATGACINSYNENRKYLVKPKLLYVTYASQHTYREYFRNDRFIFWLYSCGAKLQSCYLFVQLGRKGKRLLWCNKWNCVMVWIKIVIKKNNHASH